ncbi:MULTISPECIES: glycoside hydrolase family 3 N-terminal domain-containing protein [Mesorhizobium]|uniref:glycoside hydrolase family 3 N-terminal domain-containing protein n=1 Tax=Mesorhizobium TaxID=68287 RepID=UPI0007ECED59|nr:MULTISPECIES: glycoside hydrolase family 3 N-terminal domain-containing protein [Mesorhizobium]PBB52929.1 glycoside hydrolase [Mesorhizobium loti]QIA22537.1 glycoside hydrolase family 3 protein [Mesorhizobium sp. AA22]
MSTQLRRDIHALFLPILPELEIDSALARFLENGGISLLFGETREEYVSRVIEPRRVADETQERWRTTIARARAIAGPVLIAVDAEIGGIERLHRLTKSLPSLEEAHRSTNEVIEARSKASAISARRLGVNVFLSPVADVLAGPNPWLEGRTLGEDIGEVTRIVGAFVKGVQDGGVAATVKHFPGHPICKLDPAVYEGVVPHSLDELRAFSTPFRAGIDAGADVVMMGPAIFNATTPPIAASHSAELISMLKDEFGFGGVVLTDDLDWKATIRDMTIEESAIKAVAAGGDWMLVSAEGVRRIPSMVDAIEMAVENGTLSGDRIAASVSKLRALALRLT